MEAGLNNLPMLTLKLRLRLRQVSCGTEALGHPDGKSVSRD